MLTLFKIFMMIWPFIKEMIFGQKDAKQILKEQKLWVAAIVLIAFLITANVFLMKRIVAISQDYITLQKKVKEPEGSKQTPVVANKPLETPEKPPVQVPVPVQEVKPPVARVVVAAPKHVQEKPKLDRFQRLQKSLTDMQDDDKNDLDN